MVFSEFSHEMLLHLALKKQTVHENFQYYENFHAQLYSIVI
ncbi:hypothetical protein DN38_3611 [Vibrio cholerae]|nr:hypothetical protein DN38_3611 [Vibrio cholerae]